jgi:hypothetical protein
MSRHQYAEQIALQVITEANKWEWIEGSSALSELNEFILVS